MTTRVHTSTEFGVAGPWLAEYTLTALGAAVLLFDVDGRVSQWNPFAADVLGVTEQQLAGRRLDDDELALVGVDGKRLTESTDPVRSVLAGGEPVTGITLGARDASGATRWRSVSLLPVFGIDRHPRAVLASLVNLTDRLPAGASNAEWQLLAQSLLRSSITADLVVDPSGVIIEWNERALELTGRNGVELIGCGFTEVCDIDLDWLWTEIRHRGRRSIDGGTVVLHGGGEERAVLGRFTLARWPGFDDVIVAQLLEASAATGDASQQAAQDARVFEHAQVPLLMISERGVVVDANHRAANLLGRPRGLLSGQNVCRLIIGLGLEELQDSAAKSEMVAGTVDVGGFVVSPPDGSHVTPVSVAVTSMSREGAAASKLLVQLSDRVGAGWSVLHPELERYGDSR